MDSPLNRFTSEQKTWYAQLLVATILADEQIDVTEINSLKQALSFLDSMEDQRLLMNMIQNKTMPQIKKPKGLSKQDLGWIFTELILTIVEDGTISVKEKIFLRKVAEFFDFNDQYYNKLMTWCEQGLRWKMDRKVLIASAK